MTTPTRLTLSFPSDVKHVDLVHSLSDKVSELVGFDQDASINLGLAVREAAINAVKHGNQHDTRKKVSVMFEFGGPDVIVTIEDRGEAFDPANAPDPTLPENLHRASGRGLLLMKAFVDEMDIHPRPGGGSVVKLVKHVTQHKGGNGAT
jgi:serine/threonine-protein kinase RsbW